MTGTLHFVVVAVFTLLFSTLCNTAFADRNYAVIVGNNVGRKSERPLRYAERDARVFSDVLRRLGSFRSEDTVSVLGESAESIRRAILEVNARIRAESDLSRQRSALVVYYSGHADATGLHPGETKLSYEELRALLRGSAATVRVLILDGCRSGGLTNVKGGQPAEEFEVQIDTSPDVEGLVMISSSAAGEDSHESERLKASFFSHYLNNALIGAGDKNNDGKVTLNEAYVYAYNHTLKSSGRTTSLQHPTYAYDLKGRGELVMTRLLEGHHPIAQVMLTKPGLYLLYRGGLGDELVAEVDTIHRTRLSLPPGSYMIQQRGSEHYLEYEVELQQGETLDLASAPHRRSSYAELVRKGAEHRTSSHGVYVSAFGRGGVLDGKGAALGASAAYGLDLRYISVGGHLRFSRAQSNAQHLEFAAGLTAQHFFDLPIVSLGLGLLVEYVHHRQRFEEEATRQANGAAIGAVFTLQRAISGPLLLRLQGGPVTYVFREATVEGGAEVGSTSVSELTGWASLGIGWMF